MRGVGIPAVGCGGRLMENQWFNLQRRGNAWANAAQAAKDRARRKDDPVDWDAAIRGLRRIFEELEAKP